MSRGVRGSLRSLFFHECAPKVRREAFVTTETSLGKPYRVPKGPFPGAVYSSVGRASRSPVRKGVCKSLGDAPA
ncbi:hypothetical protein CRG98_001956 [Punica granatum]|uniref:Uncharacterized protein n=1 Tax=Punica granatum TaxID=22663 RepID=A0A2I0LAA3_PUNGR|nr:hypothetical protein CRG98_001956 [Punica granatum]